MEKIGEIVAINGSATAEGNGDIRDLSMGSPVYEGDVLSTGPESNIEIRFADETVLSQGADSRFTVDDYVYDSDNPDASEMFFNLATGTFRMVTGKIAKENPESVNVRSPLAVIGIRGTTTVHQVNQDGAEKHGAEDLTGDHVLVMTDQFGNTQVVDFDAGVADFSPGAPMTPVRSLTTGELQGFRQAVPLTTMGENPAAEDGEDGEDEGEDQNGDNGDDGEGAEENGEQAGEEDVEDGEAEGAQPEEEVAAEEAAEEQAGEEAAEEQDADSTGETFTQTPQQQGFDDAFGETQTPEQTWGGEGATGDETSSGTVDSFITETTQQTTELTSTNQPPQQTQSLSAQEDLAGNDEPLSDNEDDVENTIASFGIPDEDLGDIIRGTSGKDNLEGTSSMDAMFGFGGDDSLFGGAGGDYFEGGKGDDYIDGYLDGQTSPVDEHGATDHDVASYWNANGAVTVNLDTGLVTGADGNDTLVNIVEVVGSAYDDSLVGSNSDENGFMGGPGDDTIVGNGGQHDWSSYRYADGAVTVDLAAGSVSGADGSDSLVGINGLEGSDYDDSLFGDSADNEFEPGEGDDYVDGRGGRNRVEYDDLDAKVYVDLANNSATGSLGNDTLYNIQDVRGSDYNDTIYGDSNDNHIEGADGDDTLSGMDGADDLHGHHGDDVLYGGSGGDYMNGGAGIDTLSGGTGSDTFYYDEVGDAASTGDVYLDFVHADDTFVFDADDFNTSAGFAQISGYNGTNSGQSGAVFVYDPSTDELFYDADGDGGSAHEIIAEFANNPDDFDAGDIQFDGV